MKALKASDMRNGVFWNCSLFVYNGINICQRPQQMNACVEIPLCTWSVLIFSWNFGYLLHVNFSPPNQTTWLPVTLTLCMLLMVSRRLWASSTTTMLSLTLMPQDSLVALWSSIWYGSTTSWTQWTLWLASLITLWICLEIHYGGEEDIVNKRWREYSVQSSHFELV